MEYVYIAAPFFCKPEAIRAKALFEARGIGCTARWLTQPADAEIGEQWAMADLHDIDACDVLVALNPVEWAETGTGGRHVEFGYALALDIPILLVGVRSNVFHYLGRSKLQVFETVEEAVSYLVSVRRGA